MEFYHIIRRLGLELLLLLLATSGKLLLFTSSQAPLAVLVGLAIAATTVSASTQPQQHFHHQHHYQQQQADRVAQQQQQQQQQQQANLIGITQPTMTPPIILTRPEEIVVGAGSNVTLACSARGSPPLTFVWFQDEKNITGNADSSAHNNYSDPPPSTKLLDEHRYEIQEETNAPNQTTSILFLMNLKVTDTSVFLCWVENAAGSTISNFSLIVNDSLTTTQYSGPPNYLTAIGTTGPNGNGGFVNNLFDTLETSNLQVTIVLVAFLLLLLLTFICLFVLRQVTSSGRSSKSSQASQSSCAKNNTKLLAVEDIDGFFEHIRSGIIDIDHHSMSPAILFNNTNPKDHQPLDHQRQVTQLNHFQSASDVSSQQAFCESQASDASSQQQIFYAAQLPQSSIQHPHHQQQLQAPSLQPAFYGGQLSNSPSQQAFYVSQPVPPPLSNATSQQQQQAFYSCPPSNPSSHLLNQHQNHNQHHLQQQQAFFGGQPPGDGQRAAHTLFI